jgi:hypothetical protein
MKLVCVGRKGHAPIMSALAGFKTRWLGICGLLAVAALVAFFIPGSHEPEYDRRPLSFWLDQFTTSRNLPERSQAQLAIRHIGTNGLPALLAMLGRHDSKARQIVLRVLEKQSVLHLRDASDYHLMASDGFYVLGPLALSAEPALAKLREDPDPDIRRMAAVVLLDVERWDEKRME